MATFFSKISNFHGQDTIEKLRDYFVAIDMDLNNIFNGIFLFPQHDILDMKNLSGLPSYTAYVGNLCVVNGKLYIATASGTPATWTIVGSQS